MHRLDGDHLDGDRPARCTGGYLQPDATTEMTYVERRREELTQEWREKRDQQDELAEKLRTLTEMQDVFLMADREIPERLSQEYLHVKYLHQSVGHDLVNIGEALDDISDDWDIM